LGGGKTEGPKAESGVGVLGEGAQPPSPPVGLGSAVSSPSGVRGGSRPPKGFHYFQHTFLIL